LGSDYEPVVETDELERGGPSFGCQEGGRELEGVGGAERMDPKEAPGGLENGVHRLDPMPMPGEGIQPFEGLGRLLGER
jgi:hypothetical protein